MSRKIRSLWSRRALLEASVVAGAVAVLPRTVRAADAAAGSDGGAGGGAGAAGAQAKLPLITKTIPSTGERLPAIGIGTNSFRESNYLELRDVLARMHELGGSVIDTASGYGDSEAVIGQALADLNLRSKMFVCTKFNAEGARGMPGEIYGQASFDRSLQRLRTEHVDLLYAHRIESVDPLMPLLLQLKRNRQARYVGITTFQVDEHAQLADKMRRYPVDFVQVDYSIANRDAEKEVLPLAAERNIAVVVDVPLGGRRGSLLAETGNRPLPPWAADIDVTSWSQFFLKYVISHPAVICAIPGSTKVEHLLDNQLAAHGRLPDAAMRKRMEDYWDAKT